MPGFSGAKNAFGNTFGDAQASDEHLSAIGEQAVRTHRHPSGSVGGVPTVAGTLKRLPVAVPSVFHESLVEVGPVLARPTDLLRLLALPAFAWAAWTDVQIRRVPNRLWPPLAVLGFVLLALDAHHYSQVGGNTWRLFLIGAGLSVGVVVPLVYAFWLLGGFGGADVKALATLSILFPVFPEFFVDGTAYPLVDTTAGAFAFTILTNAVVVGMAYPAALALLNLAKGNTSRWMVVGKKVDWRALPGAHGRLLETPDGFSRDGLDLDALRMYLRWRGIDLADLRANADELRDPATLPEDPNPPSDGAVAAEEALVTDGGAAAADGTATDAADSAPDDYDDPWGAQAFLDDLDGGAYGTDPAKLRGGLDVAAERDAVWISPGIPFIVPVFLGLVLALVYGDVLFGVLSALGLA
ncbi:prepilin signal peptidase [Salinarchaeum sp. Harcht-Bsk1]|uniref:A24 family peptidase n=1 Tax=Salinarchaeum sp. Harcht-Bsk1 TaxID=1333523 RepID=UPI0003424756|nr:A24 family peptidase [Salinarchaeum sp. Harcht-Bsk1]AGN01682.1 prepilin signal peptidase [Salinarchaeum sp. Harcht-Bsk1]